MECFLLVCFLIKKDLTSKGALFNGFLSCLSVLTSGHKLSGIYVLNPFTWSILKTYFLSVQSCYKSHLEMDQYQGSECHKC